MGRMSNIYVILVVVAAGAIVPHAVLVGAAPVPETEPNNDVGNGTWMTLGTSYIGDVGYVHGGNPDPVDYFRFNLSKNQDFSITVNVSITVEGMHARVYDPALQEMNSSLMIMARWDCYQNSGNSDGVWYLQLLGSSSNYTVDTWTVGSAVDPIPKISIKSPANNSTVQSLLVDVSGNASDDKSVARVDVYPEDALPACWTKATGTTTWTATVNISAYAGHGGSINLNSG